MSRPISKPDVLLSSGELNLLHQDLRSNISKPFTRTAKLMGNLVSFKTERHFCHTLGVPNKPKAFVNSHSLMDPDDPTTAAQDMKIEVGQVVTDCLGVSLILRKIFQHFSTTELLKLSLVSKLWSYEARSLLRDRGSLTTNINKNKTCQNLSALASDLRRTKEIARVLPLSGLTVSLGGEDWTHADWCAESSARELDDDLEDIVDQLTWKHFSVQFCWHCTKEFVNCPAFLLVKKILKRSSCVLQELTLRLPDKQGHILQQVLPGYSFSRLRILKVEVASHPLHDYTNLIKTLISNAPKLEVLRSSGRVNLNGNLMEGSSAIHVTDFPFSPFRNEVPENVVGEFRMTRMQLIDIGRDFQLRRFNRITPGLLEVSRTTLNLMHIDAMFLVPLSTYGICLENVSTLEIHLEHPRLEFMHPRALRLVKCFDFTRTLPKVKAVKLNSFSYLLNTSTHFPIDGIHEMVEQGNAAFRQPAPDRAVNIKSVTMETSREIKDSTGAFLAEMFPNVQSLSITATNVPFGRIWESLHDLKVLDVTDVDDRSAAKNHDSVFCGIFPEEVSVLREQDEEYLKAVNIVPVMPSITCLKNLRNLNLIFGEAHVSMESIGDPTYLFSKVTALTAFQRCPDLTVTLITNETRRQLALSHLRPYATILPEDPHSFSA